MRWVGGGCKVAEEDSKVRVEEGEEDIDCGGGPDPFTSGFRRATINGHWLGIDVIASSVNRRHKQGRLRATSSPQHDDRTRGTNDEDEKFNEKKAWVQPEP
jgi:hypothetical protein